MTAMAIPAAKSSVEKVVEKVAEKRRALGRGLESLLPGGPRVVPAVDPGAGGAPADCGASGGRWAVCADPGRTAVAGFEDRGEDYDSCDGEAGLGAAGGGDDDRREPATAGSGLSGAGGGFCPSQHG